MAKHLTAEERGVLYRLRKEWKTQTEIAQVLGRHRSTICREIQRNSGGRGYRPKQAQRKADERRLKCCRSHKMDDPHVNEYVQSRLKLYWSPDQIARRARQEFPRQAARQLSHQTIYNWIERQKDRRDWERCLRRGGRRLGPTKRGRIPGCVSIEGRPRIVDQRRRYGDWEGDTIVGKGRRSGVLTTVDRKSGYLCAAKVNCLQSEAVVQAARRRLGKLPRNLRRTATFDNGKEFAQHEKLAQLLGLKVYFAKPYCAWQRGTNENTNGLLRQFFPKGTDFTRLSHHEVARAEKLLNERPRRRLGYRTPAEVLAKKLVAFDS